MRAGWLLTLVTGIALAATPVGTTTAAETVDVLIARHSPRRGPWRNLGFLPGGAARSVDRLVLRRKSLRRTPDNADIARWA
jgi:hypothetical protein